MISDTLSDAVADIRRYLANPLYRPFYSDVMRDRLDGLVCEMDHIRAILDSSLIVEPEGEVGPTAYGAVNEVADEARQPVRFE